MIDIVTAADRTAAEALVDVHLTYSSTARHRQSNIDLIAKQIANARETGRQQGLKEAAPAEITKARHYNLMRIASAAQLYLDLGGYSERGELVEALAEYKAAAVEQVPFIEIDTAEITAVALLGKYRGGSIKGVHWDFPDTKDSTTVAGYYFNDGREDHDGDMIGPFETEMLAAKALVAHLVTLQQRELSEYWAMLHTDGSRPLYPEAKSDG